MDLAESDLLFVDVDASTPAVKQEQEVVEVVAPEHHTVQQNRMPSADQLAYLVERLEKNPVIARGHIRTGPARLRARRFWEHVCLRLNKIPGSKKSWNQWMKYWTDKKKNIKGKAASQSDLSIIDQKVLYLGTGLVYRKIKNTEFFENESKRNALSELDISDDEFSHTLKDNVQADLLVDTSQSAGPSLNPLPHSNPSLDVKPPSEGLNTTNSNYEAHAPQNGRPSEFERILKIEERRFAMEHANAQLMRTILEQSAEREKRTTEAINSLSERLNERNERDAMMAGALKTLGDGLIALSKVIKKANDRTKKKLDADNHYKCNLCHYITYHRFLFQEHLNRHKGIKPYKCELCPYSSVSKKYAKKHQEKHKTCPCGFLSRNAVELKRHVSKCGSQLTAPVLTDAQRCASCNKEYVDGKALAKHRASQQLCSVCLLECCGHTALKTHMLTEHSIQCDTQPKKERFQCAQCPWSSSLQQKILLHLIHHPQEVDPEIVNVAVLRRCHILPPE